MKSISFIRLALMPGLLVAGLSACGPDPQDAEEAANSSDNRTDTPTSSAAGEDSEAATGGDRQAGLPDPLPAPLATLQERGIEFVAPFETPAGLTGYAATFQGQSMAVYLTPDGEHAVIGTMIDANGDNMTDPALNAAIAGPQAERAWTVFENEGDWVQDGDTEAPRVVYEITDPNCPYCARFNELARPWVDAGAVQIRHVMVGVIRPDSLPKAATIVSADDPSAALLQSFTAEGIQVAEDLPDAARERIAANNDQMQQLGYRATPTILYRDENGDIQAKQGMPRGDEVQAVLGPRPAPAGS